MYFSAYDYSCLDGRSRAERREIIGSALREYGGAYRRRLWIVVTAVVVGMLFLGRHISAGLPITDWRRWIAPALDGVLIGAYLLWEINGSIRAAVEKYVASTKV